MEKTTFQVCEFGEIQRLLKNKTNRTLLLVTLLFTSSFITNAQVPVDNNDNISFYKKFSGANLTYKQIGNSEIKYNRNSGVTSQCSKSDGAPTSANLVLPADAEIQAVYVQWFALVKHDRNGITNYAPLKTSIPITFPNGVTKTIYKDKGYRETVPFSGLLPKYEGYIADITTEVLAQPTPTGTYTADVQLTNDYRALREACAYSQENVRAWQMLVVYKSPTDESGINQVYVYDGLKGFVYGTIDVPVTGYKVYSGDVAGSISVATLQGDAAISGETISVSDNAFANFPIDFANSGGVSNPAPGNNANTGDPYGAWDIDVVNSNFTPNTDKLTLKAGSWQDLIMLDLIVLKIPTGGLVVTKKTTTPNVNIGENGTYEITLTNTTNVDLKGITAQDILPSGFTYATTANLVLNKATQTSTTTPSKGDTTLNWGTFNIDGKGSVTIIFDVTVSENEPLGTYHNAATASVSTPNDTVITNYDGSSHDEDITVGNRCDAISSGNLDTDGDGISDICDLDDDNDGILDVDENICGNSGTPLLIEDFGIGNATTSTPLPSGVSTNYTYLEQKNPRSNNTTRDLQDDFYAVFNNIPASASWANVKWQTVGDHTSGSLTPTRDNMLMVNAGETLDIIYQKTITGVTAGALLDVSFWVLNLDVDNAINDDPQRVLPNIQIELWQNGALLGPPVNTGNIVREKAGSSTAWKYYKTIAPLTTLNSSNITVTIRNNTKAVYGNDLAIDDIIVRQLCNTDSDGDGIPNSLDLDSDNDGIPDVIETGGIDNNHDGMADGSVGNTPSTNGIPNTADTGSSLTSTDNDGIPDYIDIDADNDGIPDNIEVQTTADYIAPSGVGTAMKDDNNNGIDDRYEAGGKVFTPVDTDGDKIPDYLDPDSDNDGILDITENGDPQNSLSSTDTDGDGLDDAFDDNTDNPNTGFTVNDGVSPDKRVTNLTTLENSFGDEDNDFNPSNPATGNLDYRDIRDNDKDGIADSIDLDDDNDGIPDTVENGGNLAEGDEDGDGIPNYLDTHDDGDGDGSTTNYTDADGNGIPDVYDNDGDGVPNHFDLDSDNDGIPDIVEAGGIDSDGNGKVDDINTNGTLVNDKDKDGLDDRYDTNVSGGTNGNAITNPDSDGDGIPDTRDLDSDNDGIPDIVEAGGTDTNGDGKVDNINLDGSLKNDTDNDGFDDLVDGDVGQLGTPNNKDNALIITGSTDENNDGKPDSYTTGDTDGDSIPNHIDLDSDNDGIPDLVEAGGIDTDGNGLVDTIRNNGKLRNDVDKDGFDDAVDGNVNGTNNQAKALIITGSDTNNNGRPNTYLNGDTDNDGILDNLDLDADNDGIPDLIEAGGIDTDGNGMVDNITSKGKLSNDTDNDGFDDAVDGTVAGTSNNKDNALVVTGTDTNNDGKPNSYDTGDSDKDGIPNYLDLDSDNDGIVDIIEAGGEDANRDGKVDAIATNGTLTKDINYDGFDDNVQNTPLVTTGLDTDNDGNPNSYTKGDTDSDGKPNFLDIDADDDGIPDNIEGQTTAGYKKPSGIGNGIIDNNHNGVDDTYESGAIIGLIPENTDGDTGANYLPDYLDTDADNDGIPDIAENGDPQDTLQMNAGKLKDTDGDGLNDAFDDNLDNSNNGFTVNDGLNSNKTVEDLLSLKNSFGDTDNDFDPDNPATGNLDYRDIPTAANAMITQVYQFGTERWIEITNIGDSTIPANTINVELYKNKTIAEIEALTNVNPDAEGLVDSELKAGESILFKNNKNKITHLGTATIIEDNQLTDFDNVNNVITLSSVTGVYAWPNRYDVASKIANNTSVVRIDEATTPNKNFDATKWVTFIDDAIATYQSGYDIKDSSTKRHSQDPLISEITTSDMQANTLLGLHRIKKTTTNTDGTWDNGFPDRSRYVVIDENYTHTDNRLSARKLKVATTNKLTVTDQLLVVTNGIELDGDIRLKGALAQLIQTHANTSTVTGNGQLLVDQNSEVPSTYRYNYMSSPVTSVGKSTYSLESVLRDGTDLDNPKAIKFVSGYDGSFTGTNISVADYWIYTYAAASNGRSNWSHKYKNGAINRGDGYIFKGPGRNQNYTFVGTPNDGNFSTSYEINEGQSYLIGNPFPSALNARKFIDDNDSTISTLYFWQHVAEVNANGTAGHNYNGYIGGYATQNTSMATAANYGKNEPVNSTLEAENASETTGITFPIGLGTGKYEVSLNLNDHITYSNVPSGVDSLRIIYRAIGSKKLKVKINNIERGEFTFPSTLNGILTSYQEIKFAMCIEPGSDITLTSSSNSLNPIFIDKIILKDQDGKIACAPNTGSDEYADKYKTPEPYIAIAQGFFVVGHNTGKINFNNSQREYKTEGDGKSIFLRSNKKASEKKSSNSELPVLKLGMNYSNTIGSSLHRQIGVSFSKTNSFAYEKGYDSEMYDVNPTDFYWKFSNDDNNYVIAGVQEISDDLEVPLEIVVSKNSVVTIVIDEISNINQDVFIKDKLTGRTQKINNASASYQLKTGTYTDRFVLAFVAVDDTTLSLEDDILTKQTSIFADNKNHNIVISKNQEVNINNVELYDILGKEVILWNIKEQKETYQLEIRKQIPTGIYIVKMNTDKGTMNKKVVIE
ncbi:T9SS type A sorting domain-containing protein [Polaribacter staleyi]|uniref:T9SS type A sorting domain-containing protein n=1 Tax=Polaribacter staleyi TaxID=2022337 RepID=UPI0031BB4BDD